MKIPAGMVTCPVCYGYGYFDVIIGRYNDGDFRIRTTRCEKCDGLGYVDPADLPVPESEEE